MITFNIKKKILVITVSVILGILGGNILYQRGYNAGIELVEHQITTERAKWQTKINDIQLQHNKQITLLESQHLAKIKQYKDQTNKLINDKQVLQQYIKDYNVVLPNTFVQYHDRLVTNTPLDTIIKHDNKTCTVETFYKVLGYNYNQCLSCYARLHALQQIVKDYQTRQTELQK